MFPHRVKFFKMYGATVVNTKVAQPHRTPYPVVKVQPVPAPVSTNAELKSSNRLTGNNQSTLR